MKFVIAGLLLITILPGNAGEKYTGNESGQFISIAGITEVSDSNVINVPAHISSLKNFSVPKKNCREISPSGRSFNFFMSIE